MSAPLLTRLAAPPRPAPAAPSLSRLVAVELAKVRTTRATAALVLGAVLVGYLAVLFGDSTGTPGDRVGVAAIPVAVLLAVAGSTLVTTEWHHRTVQSTFLLVPRRHRVLTAKYGAAAVLGLLAAVAFLIPSLLLAGADDAGLAARAVLVIVLGAVTGVGIGAALPSTAGALGVLVGGEIAVTMAYVVVEDLSFSADLVLALATVVGLDNEVGTGPTVTALLLWVVVPGAIGAVRLRRDLA